LQIEVQPVGDVVVAEPFQRTHLEDAGDDRTSHRVRYEPMFGAPFRTPSRHWMRYLLGTVAVGQTHQHTNRSVLVEGPEITIRPVGIRRLAAGGSR
jgi:hypothetical protein